MAGFQVNLNMRVLHLHVEELSSTSTFNARKTPSKRQQILHRILQADIVCNLKICLDVYMNENSLTGGEVSISLELKVKVFCFCNKCLPFSHYVIFLHFGN